MPTSLDRSLLRHTLATLAYRGRKVLQGIPEGFGAFQRNATDRTPSAILAHIGDLLDWSLSIARGESSWRETPPGAWEDDVRRFHDGLQRLDAYVASEEPLAHPPEKIFQGPIADALTHVGQLAMLRRMAGGPIRGENYFVADIVAGRVGPDQSPPKREFA